MKRDCLFFVADLNMLETFKGFLGRPACHLSLGCGPFRFDPLRDIRHAGGVADSLHTHAGHLLRDFRATHRKMVVAQDCAFDGSPGQAAIRQNLSKQLQSVGWSTDDFIVIAIDPELEQWIWQDNGHVDAALKHRAPPRLREVLLQEGRWPADSPKPIDPKGTLELIVRRNEIRRSSALYNAIASKVSVRNCSDPEFQRLVAQLRVWFPAEGSV